MNSEQEKKQQQNSPEQVKTKWLNSYDDVDKLKFTNEDIVVRYALS